MEYWVEFKGGKHDPKGLKGKKSYLGVVNIVKENDEFKKKGVNIQEKKKE
jgi:hypothetical protein